MQITLDLPEDVLIAITDEANRRDCSPLTVMVAYLKVGMAIPVGDRSVPLYGPDLVALEARLGNGMITSGKDLRQKVERLAAIRFGTHEITLTQAQLEELTWRAAKRGKTVEDLIKDAWVVLQENLFTYANK